MKKIALLFLIPLLLNSTLNTAQTQKKHKVKTQIRAQSPFIWEGANLYFLMTDRFLNGNATKEVFFDRTRNTGLLRGFEGGNIKGISQKIDEGYFDKLGVNAIWFTPIVVQIHDGVDEGTGVTYGFHGYWTRDWTAVDPNFGTKKDLAELVPKKDWVMFPHWMIHHGRRVCNARKPKCDECKLAGICPKIGVSV